MSLPSNQPQAAPAQDTGPQFDFLTWFEVNRRAILMGVGLVCLCVVGLLIFRAQQRATRAKATAELLQLAPPTGPGETAPALDPAKLMSLASQFPGTPAAEQAELLAAGQLFANGKYAEAQKEFASFEAKHPDSGFVGVAMLGVAASLEALGKGSEAMEAYNRVIGSSGSESFAAQARMAKARLLTATQPAQALSLYDEVINGAAAGVFGNQAAMARSELLTKHPELTPPPATSTGSTTNAINVLPAGLTTPGR